MRRRRAQTFDREFIIRVSYLEIYQVLARPHPAFRLRTYAPFYSLWWRPGDAQWLKRWRVALRCGRQQECIRDLFKPDDVDIKLHEHPEHGFYVKATEIMVSNEQEILQLMDSGEAHRHVGQTNMNKKSSPAHTN
eukprot:SAG22_NODE_107_length_19899_cov_24.034141_1_plen_134_part_10